jgi:tripartite ATP-independent transporter DctM subunit
MTSQSIGKLFAAVLIPGAILGLFFMLAIYIKIKRNPELGPAGEKYSWGERFKALWGIKDTICVIVLVIGGIMVGLFTVYEAGAIGVVGVLVAALIRGNLNKEKFLKALLDTGKTVAMIFMILIGAMVLGYFFAISQLPTNLANFFATLPLPKHIILIGIVAVYIFLGAIMDEMAMLLLTVPIFYPVIITLGFDPIWFGVMLVLIMASGMIMPPVGINCFIIAGIDKSIPLATIYAGILPFWISIVLAMILITVFPSLCVYLPNLLF